MMDNIPLILKIYNSAASALSAFGDWSAGNRGDVRAVIEELKDNSRYLWLVIEEGVSMDEVVDKLSVSEYNRLLKSGFNFNRLQKKRIARTDLLAGTDLSSWQGKETHALVVNIYDKIKDIKAKYPLTRNSKNIRWQQRVRNLQKRILLLLQHARS